MVAEMLSPELYPLRQTAYEWEVTRLSCTIYSQMVVNNGMDYMNDDPERGMMAKQHSVDEPLDQKIVLQKNTHATTHWLFHCYY